MELNKYITSQPIIFFLGAGSSAPLGMPTTLSFRKVLLNQSSREDRMLINSLYEAASNRYRLPTDSIDLERFLEFLHELRLGLWILAHARLSRSVSQTLAAIDIDSWDDVDLKVDIAGRKVLEVLHSVCGDCPGEKVRELWNPIFIELRQFSSVFPIFTLNYDWAFERLCIGNEDLFKLTDGFSSALGGNWAAGHFTNFQPSSDLTDICLFKLHGSTCWVGDIKTLGPLDNIQKRPEYGFDREESRPFEIVYPGYQREFWLGDESWSIPDFSSWRDQEPYSVLNQYFDESLSKVKVVIIIGYSFHDQEINALFRHTFDQNKHAHIIVLDPGRKWIRKKLNYVIYEPPYSWTPAFMDLEPEAWNNRLHWIRGNLGTQVSQRKLLQTIKEVL